MVVPAMHASCDADAAGIWEREDAENSKKKAIRRLGEKGPTSQSRIVEFIDPDARNLPSCENATLVNYPSCS